MRKRYDFSHARKNPYAAKLTRPVALRLDAETAAYFERLAAEHGLPIETLMRLYLAECATSGKRLRLTWTAPSSHRAA